MNPQAFLSGYLDKEIAPVVSAPKPIKRKKPREAQMLALTKKLRKKAQ